MAKVVRCRDVGLGWRLWREETGDGHTERRGQVRMLPDGKAYYFRGWPGRIGRLEAMPAVGNAETTHIDLDEEGAV